MSYENGTDFIDYFPNCIDKYKEDSKIFDRAILLLNVYMQKPTWPHCINEYKSHAEKILGEDPEFIGKYGLQLKQFYDEDENAKLSKEFKNDLYNFSKSTYDILDNVYFSKSHPFNLSSIYSTSRDDGFIVKIFRYDNNFLELEMSKREVESLINFLSDLLKEE
ncbi:TPA: hypothetical protein ACKONR_003914 [Clostridioides difficile]|uniref:hypothetical protein n=1 Tax=Clostridioides difficile TaxID=1496 RepID=UPI0008256A2D|nr:hypothetical protein [Clostridioides difficile]AXU27064.1 hypothetical protein CDIF102859_01243 [Clostridioides difficile]AXU30035.1 hypothetical protein CDIF102860_00405 [Clostridioides difficile]AXU30925.1 hypothetical protein CDIF102860_01336 [Clostridioides difficile]AXU33823.1 hypothetical protein CDIF102978_00405 [Clostridioides difficile]AXU34713.1 hypothetical protein CDIF102978_01336 [Clostridioides difficile]